MSICRVVASSRSRVSASSPRRLVQWLGPTGGRAHARAKGARLPALSPTDACSG